MRSANYRLFMVLTVWLMTVLPSFSQLVPIDGSFGYLIDQLVPNVVSIDQSTFTTYLDAGHVNVTSRTSLDFSTVTGGIFNLGSIDGIEHFTSLEYLNLTGIALYVGPPPPPAQLPNSLDSLVKHGQSSSFQHNLNDLVQPNSSLKYVDISGGTLTTLPAGAIASPALEYLDCSNNKLSYLSGLPNSIRHLDVSNNDDLTSLQSLPDSLRVLVARNLDELSYLGPLPTRIKIANLYVANNFALTMLDVAQPFPSTLEHLDLQYHPLTNTYLDFPNSLRHANLFLTGLDSIGSLPDSLRYLNCSGYGFPITTVSISCLPLLPDHLDTLFLNSTPWSGVQCLPNIPASLQNGHWPNVICNQANSTCAPVAGGTQGVLLAVKIFLDGPFDVNSGLMHDSLRIGHHYSWIDQVYGSLGYTSVGPGSGNMQNFGTDIFSTVGVDAVIDWVMIELRDPASPSTVIASRAALLQRDGDVVDVDGLSPVTCYVPNGPYHIAIRHRNHHGAMTASTFSLNAAPTVVDLSSAATTTWGTDARKNVNGTMTLWAGNVVFDDKIKYAGGNNDRDPILFEVGGATPANTTTGYKSEDTNMDGTIKYVGADNDRDVILQTIGGSVATATREEQLP